MVRAAVTTLQIYLFVSVVFVAFLIGSRIWLWYKLGIGQRGATYGTRYQAEVIEIMERQTKAVERIAALLEARRASDQ
jgi:hypothetical protein